ncbi:MAG: hypothetical protein HY760_04095 [Nitrospirae bacterium]|nr:hypothetical protein [Nitrospirota bacterium]
MTSRHKLRRGIDRRRIVSFLTLGLFILTLLPWAGCGVRGDRQGGERFIADIEGISLNPSSTTFHSSDWSLAGQLPKGLYDHAAAYWNGVLYVSGGFGPGGRDPDQSVNTREIYGFTVLPDLTLGDYTVSTIPAKSLSLPTSLGNVSAVVTGIDGHGMFAANGFLYLVGGKFQYERTDCYPSPSQSQLPCNIPTPTAWNHAIFYAPIQPDGSVSGEWTEIPLPDSIGPYTLGAAVYHGYLYLAGGWDGVVNTDRVFRAPMIADGEIGDWKEETRLPEGVSKHALVAAQGHLYVIGGNTGGAQSQEGYSQGYQNEVYVAPIDESDPLGPRVGSWSLTSSLPDTWIDHEAVALGNTLWVIGGRNVNEYYYAPSGDGGGYYTDYTVHPTVQIAQVRPDGTLTPWQDYNELPVPVLRHAAVAAESGVIFLTGGSSGQEEPPAPESCQGTQAELCSATYIRESGVYVLAPFP